MGDWPGGERTLAGKTGGATPVRGTQSFVRVMQWCWGHPGVVGLEILWRWIYGSFALWLLWRVGTSIVEEVTGGRRDLASLGLKQLTITDPVGTAAQLSTALALVLPPLVRASLWLVPSLLAAWLLLSTLGRAAVLRRVQPTMRPSLLTAAFLQLLRIVVLGASFALWFAVVLWAGRTEVSGPLAGGGQPQLVAYFAIVIVATLFSFSAWAILSWALSLAPLLAMVRGLGLMDSLRGAVASGPLRLKLAEINLVMGIVKIALIVLAMVFSACPLPFESVMTPTFLMNWTAGVLLLYLIASDFFHVARLVAYLQLWQIYREAANTPETTSR